MKHKNTLFVLTLVTSSILTGTAQASLFDRGGGLLYDDVINLTWLQDANYAKTSGYSATGQMNWASATNWAANLNYNGLTGWRLANNSPVDGNSFNYNNSYNGSSDLGYNITSTKSELSYMLNVNLGLTNRYSTEGIHQLNFGIFGNGTYNGVDQSSIGQNTFGLVNNLQADGYWSGTDYTSLALPVMATYLAPGSLVRYFPGEAFVIYAKGGQQALLPNGLPFYAWAVQTGDVAPVPIPSAIWLFGSGLLGLLSLKRLKK